MTTIPWRERAACNGATKPLWDLEVDGESPRQKASRLGRAKSICDTQCPVRDQCLAHALTCSEPVEGMWGGQLIAAPVRDHGRRKPGGQPAEIKHGTEAGYRAHNRRGDTPCLDCTDANNAARQARRERARQQVPA